MNIVIGNQKGGVGKTTHTILLANYLALEKQQELLVLDMDFQGSIKTKWDQDLEIFENEPLYEVLQLDLENFPAVVERLSKAEGYILFDLPGKMDDNNLVLVFQKADVVICPFSYDKLTFESTLVFAQVVQHINKEVPIYFLPNRLKNTVNYTIKEQVNNVLGTFGTVIPEVTDRIALQRLDCFTLSDAAKATVQNAYEFLWTTSLNKNETENQSQIPS